MSALLARPSAAELDYLTERLRAIRLPDEAAVILEIGSVSEPQCGKRGAIRVTATKGRFTATSEALRLEDALLMVRTRLSEAAQRAKKNGGDA